MVFLLFFKYTNAANLSTLCLQVCSAFELSNYISLCAVLIYFYCKTEKFTISWGFSEKTTRACSDLS